MKWVKNTPDWASLFCHTNHDHLEMSGIPFPTKTLVFYFVLIWLKVSIKMNNEPPQYNILT